MRYQLQMMEIKRHYRPDNSSIHGTIKNITKKFIGYIDSDYPQQVGDIIRLKYDKNRDIDPKDYIIVKVIHIMHEGYEKECILEVKLYDTKKMYNQRYEDIPLVIDVEGEENNMKNFKIDIFYDKNKKRYMTTEFATADNIENVKPSISLYIYFEISEDIELDEPTLFHASIIHSYSDGYDYEHNDYMKTIYVQAKSYQEATMKLNEKFNNIKYKRDGYYLNRVCKDDRDPLSILLSL